jgi:hypothetical protein
MPKLSIDLEYALLAAVLRGGIAPSEVSAEELSAEGGRVLAALKSLSPPAPPEALELVLREMYGWDKTTAAQVVARIADALPASMGAQAARRHVRMRYALVRLVNEATRQMDAGAVDLDALLRILSTLGYEREPETLAAILKSGWLPPVPRIALPSLPQVTGRLGGITGFIALAGEPGVGKSTLAFQMALDAVQVMPVLYYDLENGRYTVGERLRAVCGDNLELARERTKRLYYREAAGWLEVDLLAVGSPALVVIDSIQKLPTAAEFRRAGLDRWVHRLEGLKARGYHVLVVSEVARSQYGGDAWIGAYKETGEIEYAADLGLQLLPEPTGASLHVVKHRHGAWRGMVARLRRERGFVWVED